MKKEKEPSEVKEGNEQKEQKKGKGKGKGKRKKDPLEPPSKEAAPFNQEIPYKLAF